MRTALICGALIITGYVVLFFVAKWLLFEYQKETVLLMAEEFKKEGW